MDSRQDYNTSLVKIIIMMRDIKFHANNLIVHKFETINEPF